MHQSSGSYLTPALQNEDTVMAAGKQNGIPAEDTFHAASLPVSWDRAFIFGTIMRGGPVAEVQSFLFRNPTSQKPLAMLPQGGHITGPQELKPI